MKLTDTTDVLLTELKLYGLKETFPSRLKELQAQHWSPSEFLNLCLEDERLFRENARLLRRLRQAGFPVMASLENLDFTVPRNLDKNRIRELSTAQFVTQSLNILIAGPTGVGKTHLASALGVAACRQEFPALFFPLNRLLEKLALTRAQGRYLSSGKTLLRSAPCDRRFRVEGFDTPTDAGYIRYHRRTGRIPDDDRDHPDPSRELERGSA